MDCVTLTNLKLTHGILGIMAHTPTPLVVFGRPRWAWPVLSRPRDSTRQRVPGTQLVNWFGNNSDLNFYLAVLSNGQTKLLLPKMLAIYLGQVLFDRLIYINQTIDKVRRSVSVPDQTFLNFPRDFHQVQIGRALSWPQRGARWRRKEHWTYIFESLKFTSNRQIGSFERGPNCE